MAWYDYINPWKGRDTGNRSDYQIPGFDQRERELRGAFGGAYGPGGRQAGSSFRDNQQQVLDRLGRQMNGQDSQSAAELRRNMGAATGQQLGIAASARPGQGAMAARNAARNIGRMQSGMAGDQALAGIAERNAATNAYANLAGQARGQDIGQLGQNDAYNEGMRQLEMGNARAQQQGNQAYQGVLANQPSPFERTAALIEGGAKAYAASQTGGASTAVTGPPKMTPMAEGAVVTKPTNALVGEAGPEAVIPLHKLPEIVGKLAKMMKPKPSPPAEHPPEGAALPAPGISPGAMRPGPQPMPSSQYYGPAPTVSYYGPPSPQPVGPSQQPWRASTQHESEMYNAGASAKSVRAQDTNDGKGRTRPGTGENRPNGMFAGGVPKMTVGEWTAFLHGLGVQ